MINILKLIENTQLFLKVASAEDDLSVTTSRPKINSISATVSDRERLFNDLFNEYNRKVNPDNCTVKFGVALLNLQVVSDFFSEKLSIALKRYDFCRIIGFQGPSNNLKMLCDLNFREKKEVIWKLTCG